MTSIDRQLLDVLPPDITRPGNGSTGRQAVAVKPDASFQSQNRLALC